MFLRVLRVGVWMGIGSVAAQSAAAQDLLADLPSAADAADEPASAVLEELVITASGVAEDLPGALGVLSPHPVTVVSGAELRRKVAGTLGETLAWEPGVSSSAFAPGASRPVIRGFEGVRVRMMRDDLGTLDVSDTSPDHGISLDPLLLESIEIHRGPAALLYGNSAVGGAVNARTRVVARNWQAEAVSGSWGTRADSATSGVETAGHATLRRGPVHFSFTGSWREGGDLRIPGRARTRDYEEFENPRVFDPGGAVDLRVPNPSGRLPNSDHRGHSLSTGLAWIPEDERFRLGVAWSRFVSDYGLPYIFPGDATDFFGDVRLDVAQDRLDVEFGYRPESRWISSVDARLALADYGHDEIFRGRGKDRGRRFIETAIEKDAVEGRVDVHHQLFEERVTGVVGLHGFAERLEASRMIVPPPDEMRANARFDTANAGVFLLEKVELGEWTFQTGHRLEFQEIQDLSLRDWGHVVREAGTSHSHSVAAGWGRETSGFFDRIEAKATLSATRRLPTATERYAFWNNAAIGRFLIGGDLDGTPLRTEKSTGIELQTELRKGPTVLRLAGYHYDFTNYIFLQETDQTGGFGRSVQYVDRPADISGFEAEWEWEIGEISGGTAKLILMGDYVRGHNRGDDEPLPRMPPLRTGGRLEWSNGKLEGGLELRHAFAQNRVKPEPRPELRTESHTLLNADLAWTSGHGRHEFTWFLRATNLLNQDVRQSVSFRKDVAPLAGRAVLIGVRHDF